MSKIPGLTLDKVFWILAGAYLTCAAASADGYAKLNHNLGLDLVQRGWRTLSFLPDLSNRGADWLSDRANEIHPPEPEQPPVCHDTIEGQVCR